MAAPIVHTPLNSFQQFTGALRSPVNVIGLAGSLLIVTVVSVIALSILGTPIMPLVGCAVGLTFVLDFYCLRLRIHHRFKRDAWSLINQIRIIAHTAFNNNTRGDEIRAVHNQLKLPQFNFLSTQLQNLNTEIDQFIRATAADYYENRRAILLGWLRRDVSKYQLWITELEKPGKCLAAVISQIPYPEGISEDEIRELKNEVKQLHRAPYFIETKNTFLTYLEGILQQLSTHPINPVLKAVDLGG